MSMCASDPRVLVMLEEVAELGSLDVLATALALGRGYGVKLYLIAQDLSQLETVWGGKSKSIVANCAVRIASAPNDVATADLLSKMCGTMTVRHTMRNYSGSRLSALLPHTMTSEQDTARPLLTADEVMRIPGPRKNDAGAIVAPGNLLVFTFRATRRSTACSRSTSATVRFCSELRSRRRRRGQRRWRLACA